MWWKTIKNCKICLEPQKIFNHTLDIPRPFKYAGWDYFSKKIFSHEYIDFATITINLSNNSAILDLKVKNYSTITIDLKQESTFSLFITAYSSSLKKNQKFSLKFFIEHVRLIDFINNLKKIRDDYINEKGSSNLIETIEDKYHFIEFYNLIKIDIVKIK